MYVLNMENLEKVKDFFTEDKDDVVDFPAEILALDGKRVKLTGCLLISYEAYYVEFPLDSFAVGQSSYGCPCCSWSPDSPRPTVMNTVSVTMKNGQKLSPPFTPLVEVTGIFLARKEYASDDNGSKRLVGLFFIVNAEAKKKNSLL